MIKSDCVKQRTKYIKKRKEFRGNPYYNKRDGDEEIINEIVNSEDQDVNSETVNN